MSTDLEIKLLQETKQSVGGAEIKEDQHRNIEELKVCEMYVIEDDKFSK